MKGNNGVGNTVERDEWQTPQWLFAILDEQYRFTYDCCALRSNTKCPRFSSDLANDYIMPTDMCWMNPPFSKASDMFKLFFQEAYRGVAIYRCDNFETKIWQEAIFPHATWVFIPAKRISYEGMVGNGSRFPSALIGFNVPEPKNIEGVCLKL